MSQPPVVEGPVLAARAVHVRRDRTDVLTDADLILRRGEIVAVLGPNGAGKSTLLGALSGILPVAAGSVTRHGRVATLLQAPGLAARSARANVELGLAWWGVPRRQRRARATAALERMRADHLAHRFGPELSGGEQRRVQLARAVAVEPDVLLLDEPFDGLDPQTHVALRDDTLDAVRAIGSAGLVVLHDRADAWAIADRLVVIVAGRIRADRPPRQLLDTPPDAEVARLLGYDGEVRHPGGVRMARAAHVHLAPDGTAGDTAATVRRVTPAEDRNRLLLDVDGGTLTCRDSTGRLRPGDTTWVHVSRWVEFPSEP